MKVYQINPLQDSRWATLVDRHPSSSIFHTVAWLEALRRTYGYQPVVYTTSPPAAAMEDGLVLCHVTSWITGRRLISLPFSDHCECLSSVDTDLPELMSALEQTLRREKLRYVEIRPKQALDCTTGLFRTTHSYCLHQIDLSSDLNTLFDNCHKSSTQRKIRRAEREGLAYETGRSQALLEAFWDLLLMTRRRHGVPPQPEAWFRNLLECFGSLLEIRVARKSGKAVAAIMTMRHRDTLVYKYGGSDVNFSHLGGTQLLFWRAIEEAKTQGVRVFDLGRSEHENTGLITFKDRWGSTRTTLSYSRFTSSPPREESAALEYFGRMAKSTVPLLPSGMLRLGGRVVYRHIA